MLSFWGHNYLSKEEESPLLASQRLRTGNPELARSGLNAPKILPSFGYFDLGIIQKGIHSFKQIYFIKGGAFVVVAVVK